MDRVFRDAVRRSMSLAHLRSSPKPVSSSDIRKSFIDYFCENHNHLHVRSSPVFSLKDPTLAFTNAGMNQFKDVFLGLVKPPSERVANSQKCIRLGGTHNDLDVVGQDGSHHTFFEMLGNWSFGDYFKEETCRMSWELLTEVYNIPPERLYVTYFGGDEALGLKPDTEVQEIWRHIGVKESHILAFGTKENFWEGNVTGPCGPCTEIHFDHCPGRTEAGNLVNKGSDEVTELWNLVFTQFNRNAAGELKNLKTHFVDTGMGLERLVAVLQGKTSNYDTDLFLPLFEVIKKHTGHSGYTAKYDGNVIDCSYRILADHSRMLAVAFSDGMIPIHQNKVKALFRKAAVVAHKIFNAKSDLLKELSNHVAEILSDAYPEIGKNLAKIHYIIDQEAETWEAYQNQALASWQKIKISYPSLDSLNVLENPQILVGLEYFTNILKQGKTALTGEDVFILFDTLGVPVHITEQIALKLGLGFDMNAYLDYELSRKKTDKESLHGKYKTIRVESSYLDVLGKLEEHNVQPTQDYFKYDYRADASGKYIFRNQETTIKAILCGDELLKEISLDDLKEDHEIGLVLDRTHLFSGEGGQVCDRGTLLIEKDIVFDIEKVVKIKDFVIHFGRFGKFPSNSKVSLEDLGVLRLDENRRLDIMKNHTALHLVNTFLKDELFIVGEKTSEVTPEKFFLEFMIYKKSLQSIQGIMKLEKYVKDFIVHGVSVKRHLLSHPLFLAMEDVVFYPGETILSREVPVIEINSGFKLSREHCTGTHLLNTSDMGDFVVTKFIKGSYRKNKVEGVTGEKCAVVRKQDSEMRENWSSLQKEISEYKELDITKFNNFKLSLLKFEGELENFKGMSVVARNTIKNEIAETIRNLNLFQKSLIRGFLKENIDKAFQSTENLFVVHCIDCFWSFDPEDAEVAVAELKKKPIFLVLKSGEFVTIQCIVPPEFVSDTFSAKNWLKESVSGLTGIGRSKFRQSPDLFFYLNKVKTTKTQLKGIMETAIRIAQKNV